MGLRSIRNSLHQGKFLTDDEYERLEKLLLRQKGAGIVVRDSLLLMVAMRTGARAGELLALKKQDFDYTSKTILIRGSKGSDDREIPLPHWLCRYLNSYMSDLVSDALWPISYERLIQIWYFYRPAKKKFHSLRHTFAIKIYKQTRDLRLVQTALGHRSINNTMIYLDYVHRASELKRLVWD